MTDQTKITRTHSTIKLNLPKILSKGGSGKNIHKTTADKIRESMSNRPQIQPRTIEGGYESTHPERASTRVKTKPKRFDDYVMNYTSQKWTGENTETESRSEDEEKLEDEIKKRGVFQYMNTIKIDNEETDVETVIERKEILMTEMEYIFEKLLAKEQRTKWNQAGSQVRGSLQQQE